MPIAFPIAALEFISLPMLGWLAAALLPWLIHRWQRRQHQTTSWAAVDLLLAAMKKRSRAVHLQQWLLIAVRTAILICVALAAAQPTFRQWAIGAGTEGQAHRILVIDQSYSMGAQSPASSRWQRALAQTRQQIEASTDDAITLIGWADQAGNLIGRPTRDMAIALATLDEMRLSQASADLPVVARAILAAIKKAQVEFPHITAHEVVFCTDLGKSTWQTEAENRQLLEQVAKQARVTIINVADRLRDNVAITDLKIEPALALRQRESVITATLRNYAAEDRTNARVELSVNGQQVEERSLELRLNADAQVRFTHLFVDGGEHTIQVKLAKHGDPLPIDDSRWQIVNVRARLPIACFAGQTGAADDLARALAPGGNLGEQSNDLAPEVLSVSRLGELPLSNYAAILLCDVKQLSPREANAVTEYVRQGGGLALFLGAQTTPEMLDRLSEMLPARGLGLSPLGEYRFDPGEYHHPIIAPFRGQTQSGLLGVSISQYYRLEVPPKQSVAEVPLAFDQGDPALLVGPFGLGRVVISALPGSLAARTELNTPWSSFALSPSFLPIIRETINYLVADRWRQQRNLTVGEPATLAWETRLTAADLVVRKPDGTLQPLPTPGAEDRQQIVYHNTSSSGVYRTLANETELARFAVNLDGRDSDLSSISVEELPAGFITHSVEGSQPVPSSSIDFSFVHLLLSLALLLLLVEIGLAYWLGRGWG